MPSKLEKQGSKWTFRFYQNGKQLRKTIEAYTYKEVQKIQLDFLSSTASPNKLKNISVQAYIEEYLAYSKVNKRQASYKKDIYFPATLSNYLSSQSIATIQEITAKNIEDYKTHRAQTLKPSSVNRELDTIKAAFKKAKEWKYISENPASSVRNLKKPLQQPRFLSREEAESLIKVSEGNIKTMMIIAIYTGFRLSEVLNLQWQDIDFDANTISVNPKHNFTPKSYEFRTIPLNQELKEYLLSIQPNNAIGKDYICKNNNSLSKIGIRKAFRAAKIKDAPFTRSATHSQAGL